MRCPVIEGLVDNSPPVPQDLHDVVSAARYNLNLTDEEIARLLGVESAALAECLDQPGSAGPDFRDRIHKLWDTATLISEVFSSHEAGLAWLKKERIPTYKGKRPVDFLREGKIEPVLGLLAAYYTGAFL